MASAFVGIAFSSEIYVKAGETVSVCVPQNVPFATVKAPCPIYDLYYTGNIKAQTEKTSPEVAVFYLLGKEGILTLSCKGRTYVLKVSKGKNGCDNYFRLVDLSLKKVKLPESAFETKASILDRANALMVAMVRGVNLRGYERAPFGGITVVGNDESLVVEWKEVYVGGLLIGYAGRLVNRSSVLTKTVNIKTLMGKGWVEVYVGGWEKENSSEPVVELLPLESKPIYAVILRSSPSDRYPVWEGR